MLSPDVSGPIGDRRFYAVISPETSGYVFSQGKTIPKTFPGYGLAFRATAGSAPTSAETSGFEAARLVLSFEFCDVWQPQAQDSSKAESKLGDGSSGRRRPP